MDPFTSPEAAPSARRRGLRGVYSVVVLIAAMVALSIIGSAFWRPEPITRVTLELGGPTPVNIAARTPNETISRVLDLVGPTVAFITVPDAGRSGSGVVVHEAGFVVTNAHVVEDVEDVLVTFHDGAEYRGKVYGVDASTDLAVVKLDASTPLPAAALGDSDKLQVGEFVLALGAPFGLEATATSGIVSGLHRSGLGIARYEDFIVTDAPINRGNSGGPLVNLRGEIIGINTAIIAGEEEAHGMGGFSGVGFAIPVNVMRVVAQRLIGDGGLGRPAAGTESAVGEGAGTASLARGASPLTVAASIGAIGMEPVVGPCGEMHGARSVADEVLDSVAFVQKFDLSGYSRAHGTGFVVASEIGNLLLTNAHVVKDAAHVAVFFRHARCALPGRVIAIDDGLDLALVTLPGGEERKPLPVAAAEGVGVGAAVVAWAARLNDGGAVVIDPNAGNVTATGLVIERLASRATLLETEARIRLGDSGGPLLGAGGAVVGVMVARSNISDPQVSANRSYAIELVPAGNLAWILGTAADPGFDVHFEPAIPEGPYITVLSIDPESPLAQAGLRNLDRIIEIDGAPLEESKQARVEAFWEFKRLEPGTDVDLVVSRDSADGGGRRNVTIPFRIPDR